MDNLKQKLQNCELTIGSWITIPHPSIVEIMATAGFEWFVIDLEHTAIDLEATLTLIITIQSCGMKALVRVSKNEEVIIKRVMDMGADGVLVPMVNSKADAEQAVRFVKYPPSGARGVGLNRAQKYGTGFELYKTWLEKEAVVIAQVEHIEGVNAIDEILSVDGMDGVVIGPYDLSGSMGYPGEFEREDVRSALEQVREACMNHHRSLGFHVVRSEHLAALEKIEAGYNFMVFGVDFFFLGDKARDEMNELKSALMKSRHTIDNKS